jgi:hypothetical protein
VWWLPAGADTSPPATTALAPYVDPSQLADEASFLLQPWRGWSETTAAIDLLDGIGVQYRMPAGTDHRRALGALAEGGIARVRFSVPWHDVDGSGERLTEDGRVRLERFLTAAEEHGLGVSLTLNANSAEPTPHESTRVTLAAPAAAGDRHVQLTSLDGIVPGRSGLTGVRPGIMAGVLVTSVEPSTGTARLGQALPTDFAAGTELDVDTLAYAPLHPPGSEEFEATAAGWLRYVSAVLAVATTYELRDVSVEIWNETAFDSEFLDIAHYVDGVPLAGRAKFRQGGAAWELAARTSAFVDESYPAVRVVWGFSNTDFYATAVDALPAGTDAMSYHPYQTGLVQVPTDYPTAAVVGEYAELPEPLRLAVPEGRVALGLHPDPLTRRRLQPSARVARPPASARFEHVATEHGCTPARVGIDDPEQAMRLKARCLLRFVPFWLNKGISELFISEGWDADPLARGILDPGSPPDEQSGLESGAMQALANFRGAFAGAEAVDPRPLEFEVAAIGQQPPALTLTPSGRQLLPVDQLAILPFQVSDDRFSVAVYVLTYDITTTMEPVSMRVRIRGVAPDAQLAWYDPLTDSREPLLDVVRGQGDVTMTIEVADTARILLIDEAPDPPDPPLQSPGLIVAVIAAAALLAVLVLRSARSPRRARTRRRRADR